MKAIATALTPQTGCFAHARSIIADGVESSYRDSFLAYLRNQIWSSNFGPCKLWLRCSLFDSLSLQGASALCKCVTCVNWSKLRCWKAVIRGSIEVANPWTNHSDSPRTSCGEWDGQTVAGQKAAASTQQHNNASSPATDQQTQSHMAAQEKATNRIAL